VFSLLWSEHCGYKHSALLLRRLPSDGQGVRALADPGRIEQALINLAHNAVKYSHPGGEIRVGWLQHDDVVRFSVSDDGIGFRKRTTSYGMGLQNIADRLAALGGTFELRTSPGEGTTVSGRIPVT